ncbi:hypothetical protein KL905_000935 [Ogataea polymorpha]|uniref:Uncharacterized protein n=1 Tax=Ogataea polymorpha TaxID=460523 RepID=A0A1B7SGX2_9ASCO|nr:uncharacterized protein OGAPODRAFT_8544 [Ogataea polymorpha]KAG7881581.1 hypothetical protein KL937_001204 [Ogataea polymorpha]KAG7890726.1 hypothetical protein KL936_002010 [Ogataea polymorpha]KAG7910862.1 hypothetical protein KL906_001242 [Ogataea polymorpha]KAG7923717.1 hypothetical protein KL905_000935 [Ogataea polymorpha]KAG7927928.1 hypothetical protein KL925_002286 [Ogataea polymorpha]
MKYKISQSIEEALRQIEPSKFPEFKKRGWISHNDLACLIRSCDLVLIKDLSPYFDVPPQTPKSPDFLRQMEELKARQEELEYQKLVGSLPGQIGRPSALQEAKEVKHQVTTIVNVLISVVSVAYAVWYWTGSVNLFNDATRVLLALFAAILVLVAEVVVFGGYLRRVDEAKQRERRKKEVRKVVNSVTFTKKSQ